jgi:hypothetical protein
MPFDRDAVERGAAAIDAGAGEGQGSYRPFLPNLFWKNDGDYRYLLILNPLEEIPKFKMHPFVDIDEDFPESVIARTDKSIGEHADPIEERWDYGVRVQNLAVAVELEPMMKVVNGREKPVGFQVKTNTFDRRVRDDEGNVTDDYEEVTAPRIGLICQSPANFFSQVKWYDLNKAPIHETPVQITRINQQNSVNYRVDGFENVELDLSGLFDNIDNVGYIQDHEALLKRLEEAQNEAQAATAIGDVVLWQRIEELADDEHYNQVLAQITRPARYPKNSREKKQNKKDKDKPVQKARSREEHEKVTKSAPIAKRLEELRAKKNS